ncbi:MAG TPA: FAD-binding oxidoreductase [Acidimicrobiales bacterium]
MTTEPTTVDPTGEHRDRPDGVATRALDSLAAQLRGALVRPADPAYDPTRAVFNGMIDRRPLAVVRCAGPSDVARGITFAREHDLVVSVRGGGHSVAGTAVCDGGIMLDLSGMKAVRVDPDSRTARAEPGLTLGELDHETQAWGLATPLGAVSMTGIAGLTLGGGLGWLNGAYGLTCDNLLAADVVTADGRLVRASAAENEDLFWGLRGGGGNFGVVTSFEYRLHPVAVVLAGGLSYPLAEAPEVLRFYDSFVKAAPDELSTAASLAVAEDGQLAVTVVVCYCGPVDAGERVLRPLRTFRSPIEDTIQPMPYAELQAVSDPGYPSGQLHYWKSGFLRDLTDEAIQTMVHFVEQMPSPATGVGLQQMHGVASRTHPSATAFPHRAEQFDFLILSQWPDPADTERNIEWTRELFAAMAPHLEDAVYVNNLGNEGEDRVRAAYGPHYERLAALKAKYDPTNFFRMNHNVQPSPPS